MGFVAIGFEHCIANMYFIPVGIFLKDWAVSPHRPESTGRTELGSFLWNNLLPSRSATFSEAAYSWHELLGAYLRPMSEPRIKPLSPLHLLSTIPVLRRRRLLPAATAVFALLACGKPARICVLANYG